MAILNFSKTYPVLLDNMYQTYRKTITKRFGHKHGKLSASFFRELDKNLKPFNGKVCKTFSTNQIWVEFDTNQDLMRYLIMC